MDNQKASQKKAPQRRRKKKAPVQATPVETATTTGVENGNAPQSTLNATLNRIKDQMRITKVTATRCIKTKRGDHFVAFSSEWDSVRDDSEHDIVEGTNSGMSMKDATIALTILQFKADTSAIEAAFLGGDITESDKNYEVQNLRNRYAAKLKELANG